MISVLLVDDHSMVRDGFRQLLESGGTINVCGEADCGETGFSEYFRLKPDLMILDLNLPGESGLATLRRVINRDPEAKVLALSMYDEPSIVLRALDC
ncbi:MAG: DNA-binding response regulator, partial [Zetaproteobacteria bacterium CG_4_9_14_3_um_filter_53_7]